MTETATGGTRVRMIPATVRRYAAARPLTERLRVAAYARVSTDDEEQQTSYEAQVDYYTKKIRENPEWILWRCTRTRASQAPVPSGERTSTA